MFKELLAIYKSADDKTNIFRDQIPEDKYDAVISALETEDEAKFNDVMNAEPVSNEPVETTPAEAPQVNAPAVAETESLVEESTLPEGPIVDQPEVVTEDQQKVIFPTLDAVMHMTQDIKEASDEEIAQLPEELQEGVNIVREADDDFSMKIIAEVVDRLHHGDFSEIEEPSDKEILVTTAEAAKDLVDKGEHKTSLMRATEDIQKDLEDAKISDLIRMHTELCNLELCAKDLVEDVIEKNNLAVTPKEKEEIIAKVIDDNIFEDVTEDDLKNDIAEVIKESKDYSSRDMSEQLDIFRDFSQIKLDFDEGILSEDTVELIEEVGNATEAKDALEDAIIEVMEENPEVLERNLDASIDLKGIAGSLKDAFGKAGSSIGNTTKKAANWVAKNPGKVTGAALGAVAAIPAAKTLAETNEDDSKLDKVIKKVAGAATIASSSVLGSKAGEAIQNKITKGKSVPVEASCGDSSEGDMGKWSDDKYDIQSLIEDIRSLPDGDEKRKLTEEVRDLQKRFSKSRGWNIAGKVGTFAAPIVAVPATAAAWATTAHTRSHEIEPKIAELQDSVDKLRASNMSEGDMGAWSNDRRDLDRLAKSIRSLSGENKAELKSRLDDLKSRYSRNRTANVLGKVGSLTGIGTVPGVVAWGVSANNRHNIESDIADLKYDVNKAANLSCGDQSKDCSEEASAEGELNQDVINNALSNDDQIRALVEKYKMLPTVEAKDQMKADMQTLGFGDDVIAMIEQYAEGNFSEGEDAPAEEVPAEAAPEAPVEETVDVASQVAPELFDELLGPGVGETDPVDGTLPPGEIEAPGTDLGHLGTFDQGIPSGEVVPEDDKEVAKVQIVNAEEDNFDDIMR